MVKKEVRGVIDDDDYRDDVVDGHQATGEDEYTATNDGALTLNEQQQHVHKGASEARGAWVGLTVVLLLMLLCGCPALAFYFTRDDPFWDSFRRCVKGAIREQELSDAEGGVNKSGDDDGYDTDGTGGLGNLGDPSDRTQLL